jgi:hypothetical protein
VPYREALASLVHIIRNVSRGLTPITMRLNSPLSHSPNSCFSGGFMVTAGAGRKLLALAISSSVCALHLSLKAKKPKAKAAATQANPE